MTSLSADTANPEPSACLDPLAAVSLRLFTFDVRHKPDRDFPLSFSLPFNMLYLVELVLPRAPMAETREIMIEHDGLSVPAKVYWPLRPLGKPAPLMVYYHGGGFVMGTIQQFDSHIRSIASATGAMVLAVDYRLAPRHPFPAALEDSYAALQWAAENAAELGADPDQLIVAGDSAGGNIAAVMALMAKREGGPQLAGQVLYYPAVELTRDEDRVRGLHAVEGYGLNAETILAFTEAYGGHVRDLSHPDISPINAKDLVGLPPTMIVTAGYDPLTDGARDYARRLEQAGVEVVDASFPDMIHGFMSLRSFYQQWGALRQTREFIEGLAS